MYVYEPWKKLSIVDVIVDFSVAHYAIWLAVRMSQMLHCIGFEIGGNCELFYNWVVFLNAHCISLDNDCYSLLGLRR